MKFDNAEVFEAFLYHFLREEFQSNIVSLTGKIWNLS